ncbi:MAG: hypothetical protein HGA28_03795 [Anaerolineaceae bacterium]|nr:hypothetical protein [Anaerolineaceae bacterium]
MKVSRLIVTIILVVVFIFTSVTPARADAQPQAEGGSVEGPDLNSSNVVTDDYIPQEDDFTVDATPPYPLAPKNLDRVYNVTPRLIFSHNPAATAYKIYMYDIRSATPTLVYTYKGGLENCATNYCWLQPPNRLQVYKSGKSSGGYYRWKVEAKIGSNWVESFSFGYFYVLSKGYTSTFDVDTKGWEIINGTWTRTSSGYYKTKGGTYTNVNSWRREYFLDGVVIEARIKRKGDSILANRIYFFGSPYDLWSSNVWQDGYSFVYYNNGSWALYKYLSGASSLLASASTPYAETSDWNTFKIWVRDSVIYIWINGVYITGVEDASVLDGGAVGLAMYEDEIFETPLLMDYVKVYYSVYWPAEVPAGAPTSPALIVDQNGVGDYPVQ